MLHNSSFNFYVYIKQIDKDGAEPERVMQELSALGLMPEDWGGDIPMVQVSLQCIARFKSCSCMPDSLERNCVVNSG